MSLYNGSTEVADAVRKTLGLESEGDSQGGQVYKFACRSDYFPDGPWQSGVQQRHLQSTTRKKTSLTLARIRNSIDNNTDVDESTTVQLS